MASPAQVTANIANAQNSSGPRTETGKAASSQNALKHGLTAQTVLLPGEDEAAYGQLCEGMFHDFTPDAATEKELIQLLCDTQWRLHRCSRLEAAILSQENLDLKALDIVSKHEVRLKKVYSTTLQEARSLKDARRRIEWVRMKEAMVLRRADVLARRETDLQQIGFVFSCRQIDAAIRLEDLLAGVKQTFSPDLMSLIPPAA
jgi:hypothetical protein